jgi:APA family basic amino acid/polyamine antiporter
MAAAAVTFAAYFVPLTGAHIDPHILAVAALALFTMINCLGVREGTNTQNAFMIGKIVLIASLVAVGFLAPHSASAAPAQPIPSSNDLLLAFGLALVPVLFAYSGWQTSSFMSAELRNPQRTLPRGMWLGVGAVVVLYLGVNAACLWALGAGGLAATHTPASDIARLAFGPVGERILAGIIAISTLGFISNQILTSPRVYFQMAAEGVFFKSLATISARTHVPTVAIIVQGIVAIVIALSGQYDAILNYVTSVDYVFFGLSAIALFIFRKRDAEAKVAAPTYRMPGHPFTTALFLVVAWSIVLDVALKAPRDAAAGLGILLSGVPVYYVFDILKQRVRVM